MVSHLSDTTPENLFAPSQLYPNRFDALQSDATMFFDKAQSATNYQEFKQIWTAEKFGLLHETDTCSNLASRSV